MDTPREGADSRVAMDPGGDWGGGRGWSGQWWSTAQLLLKEITALTDGEAEEGGRGDRVKMRVRV